MGKVREVGMYTVVYPYKSGKNWSTRVLQLSYSELYIQTNSEYKKISSFTSDREPVSCSVPQVNILGPSLFLFYISKLYPPGASR